MLHNLNIRYKVKGFGEILRIIIGKRTNGAVRPYFGINMRNCILGNIQPVRFNSERSKLLNQKAQSAAGIKHCIRMKILYYLFRRIFKKFL